MRFVPIPGGEFPLGDRPGLVRDHTLREDHDHGATPRVQVKVSRPYYLGATEVTIGHFREFVEATGYVTDAERTGLGGVHPVPPRVADEQRRPEWTWRDPGFDPAPSNREFIMPVVQVTWNDAVAFCRWLSEKEGRTYRLPTEAEWERAARAGSLESWPSGNDVAELRLRVNVADRAFLQEYPSYRPLNYAADWSDRVVYTNHSEMYSSNSLGLHNMHGNVLEWCRDYYDPHTYERYAAHARETGGPVVDPAGPEEGTLRVQRGGSWYSPVIESRSSYRAFAEPVLPTSFTGFRVLLEIDPPAGSVPPDEVQR